MVVFHPALCFASCMHVWASAMRWPLLPLTPKGSGSDKWWLSQLLLTAFKLMQCQMSIDLDWESLEEEAAIANSTSKYSKKGNRWRLLFQRKMESHLKSWNLANLAASALLCLACICLSHACVCAGCSGSESLSLSIRLRPKASKALGHEQEASGPHQDVAVSKTPFWERKEEMRRQERRREDIDSHCLLHGTVSEEEYGLEGWQWHWDCLPQRAYHSGSPHPASSILR